MSDTFSKVEVITGVARRRGFSTDLKLAVVAETMQPGMSVSYVARRHGLSPSLVFRWRQLMSEGGKEAVRADDEVVAASEVRRLEERVLELGREGSTLYQGRQRPAGDRSRLLSICSSTRKPGRPGRSSLISTPPTIRCTGIRQAASSRRSNSARRPPGLPAASRI